MHSHRSFAEWLIPCTAILFLCFVTSSPAFPQGFQSADLSRFRNVGAVALSPDGHRIAYTVVLRDGPGRPSPQIWILDVATGISSRLAGEKERTSGPKWSPDGKSLAYFGGEGDQSGLWVARADGSGAAGGHRRLRRRPR
jgi:Tol biopolymer transport system component